MTPRSHCALALALVNALIVAPSTTAQQALPKRVEIAAIGLCAFAPNQVPLLVDAMAATGRARIGVKFLAQSFGSYQRATQLVEDFLLRTNGSLTVTTYLDDGPNRRDLRAWFRPNLSPTAFWDKCASNDMAFLAAFRSALVEPYQVWATERMAWAMQRGLAPRLAFVCVPALEDDADRGRDASAARRAYVNLLNVCVTAPGSANVQYSRNPVISNCLLDRAPGSRLANRPWVGIELHGNRGEIAAILLGGDGWGNDGAFISYRGETWVGTPSCDRVLTVANWRSSVLTPALEANASPSYWHPAFNGHWPLVDSRRPQDRGPLRPFEAAPQLASAIRAALTR